MREDFVPPPAGGEQATAVYNELLAKCHNKTGYNEDTRVCTDLGCLTAEEAAVLELE